MGTSYRARGNVVREIKARTEVEGNSESPEVFLPEGTELPKNITALRESVDMSGEMSFLPGQYLILGNGKPVVWNGDDWKKFLTADESEPV